MGGTIVLRDVCPHCGKKLERRTVELFGKVREVTVYASCGCAESQLDGEDAELFEGRYESAGIPHRYLNAECDLGDWPELVSNGRSLYICGPYGVGKTYFACALAKALINRGVYTRFENSGHIMSEIKGLYDGNATDALERAYACKVLVLDDLGKEQPTEHSIAMLYELVDSRYMAGKPIVATSNFTRGELLGRLGRDSATAESLISRLCEDASMLHMDGADRRLA